MSYWHLNCWRFLYFAPRGLKVSREGRKRRPLAQNPLHCTCLSLPSCASCARPCEWCQLRDTADASRVTFLRRPYFQGPRLQSQPPIKTQQQPRRRRGQPTLKDRRGKRDGPATAGGPDASKLCTMARTLVGGVWCREFGSHGSLWSCKVLPLLLRS